MAPGHHHGQEHGPVGARAGARYQGRLAAAFVLIGVFFVVEAITALLTNSLALLSDAAHMLTDVLGLGMALAAIHLATRLGQQRHRTFGLYRLEILAALGNAVLLLGAAGYVLFEAVRRVSDPPEVTTVPMLAVAVLGLGVNVVAFALLRQGATESLNVRGAYLEVLADMLGSVGVVVAGVVLELTGWRYIDPLVAAAIGLFVVPRTWNLASQAVRVLVQAAPPHLDLEAVRRDLESLPGVVDVHDLHVWTLTSDMEVASAHVMVSEESDGHAVLDGARDVLRSKYRVVHATLQVEPENHTGCEQVTW